MKRYKYVSVFAVVTEYQLLFTRYATISMAFIITDSMLSDTKLITLAKKYYESSTIISMEYLYRYKIDVSDINLATEKVKSVITKYVHDGLGAQYAHSLYYTNSLKSYISSSKPTVYIPTSKICWVINDVNK